jgi:hypothetical protein
MPVGVDESNRDEELLRTLTIYESADRCVVRSNETRYDH